MAKTRIYVLYDSITNSVFPSQVLAPIIAWLAQDASHKAVLISFENKNRASNLVTCHNRLSVIIAKKLPFIGTISLYYAAMKLQKKLRLYNDFDLIARGPLAGWICLNTVDSACNSLTIQVRGLLAEEYAYEHSNQNGLFSFIHQIRAYQMRSIEHSVFSSQKKDVFFESVSPALKIYLMENFGTISNKIVTTSYDIPSPLSSVEYRRWRQHIRSRLGIATDTKVYCYNGSLKPWQCPEMVIDYFKKQAANSFLLVVTQDKTAFEYLLQHSNINPKQYAVVSLAHTQVIKYLAASDFGLLFRKPHIINWVSRPTKLLEYQAAHLEIVHNGTIAWLTDSTMREQNHKITGSDCQVGS